MFTNIVFICLFILNGVVGDEVKTVSVMEGDSVTLYTDITELQKDEQIEWRFEPQSIRLAQIIKQANWRFLYDDVDVRFRDRLKLDNQTGSLTITNAIIRNSGIYQLQMSSKTKSLQKRFNVTVYARLPFPVVTRHSSKCSLANCSLLCSVMNDRNVNLSWYKGNSLLSRISESDLNIRLSLPLEIEDKDNNTYTCVVNNPVTNQTTHLNITELCQTCPDNVPKNKTSPIVITLVVLVIVGVVGGICFMKKKKDKEPTPQGT